MWRLRERAAHETKGIIASFRTAACEVAYSSAAWKSWPWTKRFAPSACIAKFVSALLPCGTTIVVSSA